MRKEHRPYEKNPSRELSLSILDDIQARCTECPECGEVWNWTGNHKKAMHHAVIERNKMRINVRRAVWSAFNPPPKEGYVITTKCENPQCINPKLIISVHRGYVIRKMIEDGVIHNAAHLAARTKARRERGTTKLNMDIAREIRQSDLSAREFAKKLGVTHQMVLLIRQGKFYREVNPFTGLGAR